MASEEEKSEWSISGDMLKLTSQLLVTGLDYFDNGDYYNWYKKLRVLHLVMRNDLKDEEFEDVKVRLKNIGRSFIRSRQNTFVVSPEKAGAIQNEIYDIHAELENVLKKVGKWDRVIDARKQEL